MAVAQLHCQNRRIPPEIAFVLDHARYQILQGVESILGSNIDLDDDCENNANRHQAQRIPHLWDPLVSRWIRKTMSGELGGGRFFSW